MRRHLRIPHLTAIVGILVLAGCVALVYFTHFNIGAVISVSALLGAIPVSLAFGLSSVLQGIVAGVVIRSERKFHLGDTLLIAGFTGEVTAINLRTTELVSPTGRSIIPNATVLTSPYSVLKEEQSCTD